MGLHAHIARIICVQVVVILAHSVDLEIGRRVIVKVYKLLLICFVVFLSSCMNQPPAEQSNVGIQGDKFWTLDFFYFYKGKQTHTESLKFVSRRDCFDTLYQMQVDSKKLSGHSGAGICTKHFVEGQKRTKDDLLGYR